MVWIEAKDGWSMELVRNHIVSLQTGDPHHTRILLSSRLVPYNSVLQHLAKGGFALGLQGRVVDLCGRDKGLGVWKIFTMAIWTTKMARS